ncbi:hypothetical protein IGI42_004147 [Enterococcus sp. AZ109]
MDMEYKNTVSRFEIKQGVSAVILVFITTLLGYLHGLVLMQDFPISVIQFFNTFWPIIDLLAIFPFLFFFKENLRSVGITSYNLKKTLITGFIGALLLIFIYLVLEKFINGFNDISFQFNLLESASTIILFAFGSVSEELIYRGYIETRLHGLIKNTVMTSILTAGIFLLAHYPVF